MTMELKLYLIESSGTVKTFAICKRFRLALDHPTIRSGGFKSNDGTIWKRGTDKLWRNYGIREIK